MKIGVNFGVNFGVKIGVNLGVKTVREMLREFGHELWRELRVCGFLGSGYKIHGTSHSKIRSKIHSKVHSVPNPLPAKFTAWNTHHKLPWRPAGVPVTRGQEEGAAGTELFARQMMHGTLSMCCKGLRRHLARSLSLLAVSSPLDLEKFVIPKLAAPSAQVLRSRPEAEQTATFFVVTGHPFTHLRELASCTSEITVRPKPLLIFPRARRIEFELCK